MNNNDKQKLEQLKRAAALHLLQKRNGTSKETRNLAQIPHADRSAALPLSWAQQRLWFLDQLDHAAGAAYHIPAALRLRGALHRDALQATLDRIVARHESLRTTFVHTDADPVQVIAPADTSFALAEHDLRLLAGTDQQEAVHRLTAEEAAAPFDLARGPLIRGRLLRLAEDEHILLVTQHHIISDGWSIGVLIGEVATLYSAFQQGLADPLPPLAIQYPDYASWQRQWLQGDALQEQADFWRNQLDGAPALLELPTDRPRPAVQSYSGGRVAITLPTELGAGLRALARRRGATLFMTLLAGWAIVLSRLSGQSDVVIGTAVANRQRAEIESLIGFFINTLALRVKPEADASVAQLLDQVRATTLAAYAHQDLPFEQVVEAVNPPRSLNHSPLFQALFTFDNTPSGSAPTLPGLNLEAIEMPLHSAHFDLSLLLGDVEGVITGTITYTRDLFDATTVERIAGYLHTVLAAMVADDQQTVGDVSLLSLEQQQQILVQFNATDNREPHDQLIHQLFEQQADRQPDAPAVMYGDDYLSYAQLNQRANRIAHQLIALGVRPDDRIAICVERSIEMVVGLLAILKAGAAYVPLDPAYPQDRLAYMLADSTPVALLTQRAAHASLPTLTLPCLLLDADASDQLPSHNPDPLVLGLNAHHLAYLIYTSGSTGLPKGVMVEHRSAVNFWRVLTETTHRHVPAQSRIGLNAAFSFDMSLKGLLQLLSGHCVVLIPQLVRASGAAFLAFVDQYRIDAFDSTPSQLDLLLAAGLGKQSGHQPTAILLGGEALSNSVWQQLKALPTIHFYNMYGPTECTVDATLCSINSSGEQAHIGRPFANMRIYILDAQGKPVPLGVAGEIHIGGIGVARGYLNRPELTAERFLADPFSTDPQARMYKTGDLGRWLPDGNIEYLGRNDFQVKIRGFRIELGEIEARLRACAGVRDALVIAREDQPGDKRLVAYLVAEADMQLDTSELRARLATDLAEYMIPSAFVAMEAFPLTPNGKLDRTALPAPDQSAVVSRAYEAPIGPVEELIAHTWQDLLDLERIGRHDHFFELGGHSLMVIILIERLRQQDLMVDVRTVFAKPTLIELAESIVASTGSVAAFVVPPNRIPHDCKAITPDMLPLVNLEQEKIDRIVAKVEQGVANIQDIYPLAPLQDGILFHHLLETEGDAYLSRKIICFDSRRRLDDFLSALQEVIDRHDILRTAVFWEGLDRPVQVVHRDARLPVEELTLSADATALEQMLERVDPRRLRMDLRRAPLLAAYVAADPHSGEWLLALLNHHMVSDHVTLEFILAEIGILLKGDAYQLSEPLPYRNFIAQTHAVPVSEHEAYFRRQLGDVDEPTAPFGVLDVQGDGDCIDEAHLRLDDALALRIRASARQQGVTPAVLFHVAYAQVLAQCSGRDDVVFGTVLSGRLQGSEGADRVLGMFINTLPIRVQLAGLNVHEAVRETQQGLNDLLAHEQTPLSLAQRCSGVQQPMPLFTALLNYRHSHGNDVADVTAWDGVRPIAGEERTNYPFTASVDDLGQGFSLKIQCASGIDSHRVAAYFECALTVLVHALYEHQQAPIASLPILPAAERQQLLTDWNQTAAQFDLSYCMHELFEQRVANTPDAIAVVDQDTRLNYATLNERSNQLARYLRERGLTPNSLVGIYVNRSVEMVLAIMAVMKAGGAFVPLDPDFPTDRLAYMLEDSKALFLLQTSDLPSIVQNIPHIDTVCMDTDWKLISGYADDNLPCVTTPKNWAYMIYTSGSTGRPKGALLRHDGAVNHMYAKCKDLGFLDEVHFLQNAPSSSDVSVWQVLLPLITGGRSVILREPTDFAALLRLTQENKLSIIEFVPSLLTHFVEWASKLSQSERKLPHLHYMMVMGDVVSVALINSWLALYPDVPAINAYGPTEASDDILENVIRNPLPVTQVAVPIGKPLANLSIYILNKWLQPVPIGVPGELYVAGIGVGEGYFNNPEKTAQAFLDNPFDTQRPRMYKTGDIAKYANDGNVIFLGRIDHQIKIRGFRVELEEIQSVLASCEGVLESVVIAQADGLGDKRLVAYVVAHEGVELSLANLRAKVSATLAEYMVPSAFVLLPAMPLTPNGKLDRRALPEADQASIIARDYEAPNGEIEQAIAQIWQDLLRLDRIGRHDHFFELGGHSLFAIQVAARIKAILSVDIPLRELFVHPTLADFATHILSLKVQQFAESDVHALSAEIDSLSEEELRALLAQEQ